MFGGHSATLDDPRLYGEFALEPDAKLADVASMYDAKVLPGDEGLTVAELFRRELAGDIEPGDRIAYGPVDLIVRQTNDDHAIEEVGLALEPTRQTRPRIPVFQNRQEIAAFFRGLRRRTDEPAPGAATSEAAPPEEEAVDAEIIPPKG
jgi:cell volume regulation protein A